MKLRQEPLSINIVNTNHLHLSGYNSGFKPSHNNSGETDKKDDRKNSVKQLNPNQQQDRSKGDIKKDKMQVDIVKTRPNKYEKKVKTTKPKSYGKKPLKSNLGSLSKRGESEKRKLATSKEATNAEKRSLSQPPNNEYGLFQAQVEDNVFIYASGTRTGMIPGKDDKQNQDRFFITPNFASIKNNWLFGVMDGHGVNGHFASEHVKQYLPANIELLDYMLLKEKYKEISKAENQQEAAKDDVASNYIKSTFNLKNQNKDQLLTPTLLSEDRREKYTVISEGFIKTAIDVQNQEFNVDFSGTTVVTVMLSGTQLTCANLGDSRAILGSLRTKEDAALIEDAKGDIQIESVAGPNKTGDKMWMCTALSIDHKPDRKDEYQRIMENNGRVDPFREENGDPVGPARVWLREQQIPGLAMSRSIGDLVAASVGVIPEPEFFELQLNESDKFLVLATDGVWEFIDNDECVRLVSPFWEANPPDPKGAVNKLIELSVQHWEREDEVIDDITVVVVFLKIPPAQAQK